MIAPWYLFMDANFEMGESELALIGSHQQSTASDEAHYLEGVLVRIGAGLPQTYETKHKGARHAHQSSIQGVGKRRIDYVAVPKIWMNCVAATHVTHDFDAFTSKEDHWPVVARIRGQHQSRNAQEERPRFSKAWLDTRDKAKLQEALTKVEEIPVPPWDKPVHEHREEITTNVHEILAPVPKARTSQRKPYASSFVQEIYAVRTYYMR